MHSLADYEDYIFSNFINEEIGIDLTKFTNKTFERDITINLTASQLLDFQKLQEEIKPIIDFLNSFSPNKWVRPIWYKVNVMDQAVNNYVGIGRLNLRSNWLKFILDYLSYDRADEGGDTTIAIFDIDFLWTVCFTLSQDDEKLTVQRLEK